MREDLITQDNWGVVYDKVDLGDMHEYLCDFKQTDHFKEDRAYFDHWDDRKLWYGTVEVAIYRYLVDKGLIQTENGEPPEFFNKIDYLYRHLLDHLVVVGLVNRFWDEPCPEHRDNVICYYDLLGLRSYTINWEGAAWQKQRRRQRASTTSSEI